METARGKALVTAQDGQWHIVADVRGVGDAVFPTPSEGLLAPGSGGVAVVTGTEWGKVAVEVRLYDSEPAPEEGWEQVETTTKTSLDGQVAIVELYGFPPDLPRLMIPSGSPFGIRVHANGRASRRGEAEDYLVQLWPVTGNAAVDKPDVDGVARNVPPFATPHDLQGVLTPDAWALAAKLIAGTANPSGTEPMPADRTQTSSRD